ncbi:MAG: hypothetical protein JSS86_07305 [Cyanobacteria bacterium SZAS LIN-2]|nr:hypothetical protein [Cyanobacteria bacterium SZAS LIN-2]MBS2006076.1 hypothetical protein [Cyanobacteria bacterium SZAS TMP-1]
MDNSFDKLHSLVYWPPLPLTAFVSGRVATQQDVDNDIAAFSFPQKLDPEQVAKLTGEEKAQAVECQGSKPLDIVIPQYAILNLKGEEHACIIIQGEEVDDTKIVGCRLCKDNNLAIGLLEDFRLLGKETPQ